MIHTSFWIFDNAFKCQCRIEHHWLLACDHLLVNCVIEVSDLKQMHKLLIQSITSRLYMQKLSCLLMILANVITTIDTDTS